VTTDDHPPVTYHRRGYVGSGQYVVIHTPCGEEIGRLAHRGNVSGGSWYRVGVPPMSWRSPKATRCHRRDDATALLLTAHTCPTGNAGITT
jgi:hypothetical protein